MHLLNGNIKSSFPELLMDPKGESTIAFNLYKNNLLHMKNKFLLLGIALAALSACKTASPLQVTEVQTRKNISINNELKNDEEFVKFIEPYKQKLDKEMNLKISHTNVDLTKQETIAIWVIF